MIKKSKHLNQYIENVQQIYYFVFIVVINQSLAIYIIQKFRMRKADPPKKNSASLEPSEKQIVQIVAKRWGPIKFNQLKTNTANKLIQTKGRLTQPLLKQQPKQKKQNALGQVKNNNEQFFAIIDKLTKINMQEKTEFQKLEKEFIEIVKQKVYFVGFKPFAQDQIGEKLVSNGKFIKIWCKLLLLNPYINSNLLISKIYKEYTGKITTDLNQFSDFIGQQLEKYASEKHKIEKFERPSKLTPLKKSKQIQVILQSNKKPKTPISFEDYQKIYKSNKKQQCPSKKQVHPTTINEIKEAAIQSNKQALLKTYDKFLIDYLEINEIYYLNEIKIVAIVENDFMNKGCYSILLVKLRQPNSSSTDPKKEFVSIMNLKHQGSHQINVLKQIEKKWVVQAFITGNPEDQKNLQSYWLSHIQQ